jgi:hypothetical protein
VHEVETLTYFAGIVKVPVSAGSPINGVEHRDFLIGEFETSVHESFPGTVL